MPVYVAETDRQAREEAEASTMHFFRAISTALKTSETRQAVAERLKEISYEDVLREQVIYGSPGEVADRLLALREDLGFSGFSAWMNCGGQLPSERVLTSMRLFAERVIPRLT
jgi:alkanesulfonate monooxygenase SsuD/methylene tetrahydromethanopterin reductase-like flavin-dependent oxidoreductase (luciferase family)